MSAMLEVRDLKKYFRTGGGTLHAVDGINFESWDLFWISFLIERIFFI